MSTKVLTIPLVALTLLGCHNEPKEAPVHAADTAQPSTPAIEQGKSAAVEARPELRPQTALVELGYSPNEDGAVTEGMKSRRFLAGLSFVLAVRTVDLGEGASVSVRWRDANGQDLSSETKRPTTGQSFLDFANPDTTQWTAGFYRVEVESSGKELGKLEFEIFRAGASGG